MIWSVPNIGKSQHWQSILSVDSRVGYSTNTYLNPYLAEWDQSVESAYGMFSLTSQSFWYKNSSTLGITGGLVYEPFFGRSDAWKGGIGMLRYNYRFSDRLSGGAESGISYFSSSYRRSSAWIQPTLTWFVSSFTLFRAKAGTTYRSYKNYPDSTESNQGFNSFGFEFETWPSYHWSISAGLYGELSNLTSLQKGFSSRLSTSYVFNNGALASLNLGLEQYQLPTLADDPSGGGLPGIPTGEAETVNETDRLFHLGISGSYPLNERFTIFGTVKHLGFDSEVSEIKTSDFQVSAGIRLSFRPRFGKQNDVVAPDWNVDGDVYRIRVHYSGEGQLYLVGDFNNWSRPGVPLVRQEKNTFVAELDLTTGAYAYKVLVVQGESEKWLEFSEEIYTVQDGFGGDNAILLAE